MKAIGEGPVRPFGQPDVGTSLAKLAGGYRSQFISAEEFF